MEVFYFHFPSQNRKTRLKNKPRIRQFDFEKYHQSLGKLNLRQEISIFE